MMEKILTNWPIKLVSLIFSISLWFYVVQGTNPIRTREFNNIPVTIKNEDTLDLSIVTPQNPTVSFRVKGRRNTLNNLRRTDIEVVADMNGVAGTTAAVELFYHVPDDVSIIERSHSAIVFTLDKEITVEKKIEINRIGEIPSKDLEIFSIDLGTDIISVTGYSMKIDRIKKVVVDVNLDDISKDTILTSKLKILDEDNKLMEEFKLSNTEVKLSINLKETKNVLIKPVIINEPEGFNVDNIHLNIDKIKIQGPSRIINTITEISTEPIDIKGIKATTSFDANLVVPEEVFLVNNDDIQVKVILSEKPTEATENNVDEISNSFIKNNSDIQIKNLSYNLKTTFLDNNSFKVTMYGGENIINKLSEKDIFISIDAKDLVPGDYELPILINKIENINKVDITPTKCRIRIK